jgi:mRNA interferase MazF
MPQDKNLWILPWLQPRFQPSAMKRGEIWWADLPNPVGSGPGYKRPVLVVQANPFNASRIATVIVATVTSNLALAEAPGNVRIGKSDSGLPQSSVINVSQLITLDRSIFTSKVKALPGAVMDKVDSGLKLVLSLS